MEGYRFAPEVNITKNKVKPILREKYTPHMFYSWKNCKSKYILFEQKKPQVNPMSRLKDILHQRFIKEGSVHFPSYFISNFTRNTTGFTLKCE